MQKLEQSTCEGDMAERSKAPESGSGPKGRGFESHCRHRFYSSKFRLSLPFAAIKCAFYAIA